MITEIDANLLEYPLDGIIQSCNCFHIMGGGIAARIKEKFPDAYKADLKTPYGDQKKLGTFSYAVLDSNYHIFNLYGQYSIGMGRQTHYEAIYNGLDNICNFSLENGLRKLGLPKNMGCVLGGGNWRIVRTMIDVIFSEVNDIELFICNYDK